MTARRFIRGGIVSGGIAVLLAAATVGAAGLDADSSPVTLQIMNATAGSPLRCQLILAHFVTQDAGRIDAGGQATIGLRRSIAGGTLIYSSNGGRHMALENVLCGRDDDRAARRYDLDLAALRNGSLSSLRVVCSGQEKLVCKTAP